jgi:parvulin-like peptidyl-prolyl isomerase
MIDRPTRSCNQRGRPTFALWYKLLSTAILSALVSTAALHPASGQATAATGPATGKAATAGKPSGIVANVNGIAIFRRDVERDIANAAQGQKVPTDQLAQIQATALQQRIDQALKQSLLASQKITASKEEVEATMQQLRKELQNQKSNLDDFLVRTKQSETSLRALFAEQLAWKKFVQSNATEANLEAFFKQFHERFDGTERRVSHILFRPTTTRNQPELDALKKQAEDLREKIKAGSISFESAAEKYSAGPSRLRGGDLGFIPPQGVMVEQFSNAAFSIPQGEVSPPVTTPFGIHLIKVTDTKPGKKTLRDVSKAIEPAFSEALSQQLIAQQRTAATIEFADDFPHFKPGTTELVLPATAP